MNLPILSFKRTFDPRDPDPCSGCGDCCRYVTAQIKAPRSRADYDEIRWFLLHENVQVFVDDDGWYIEFATTCRHLQGHRCGTYASRPAVCSDYDVENCTRYGDGEPHKHLFTNEDQYLNFLRRHRPKAYAWVMNPRPKEAPLRRRRAVAS